jgi:hypothetical protein
MSAVSIGVGIIYLAALLLLAYACWQMRRKG